MTSPLYYKKYPGHRSQFPLGQIVVGRDFCIIAGPCSVDQTFPDLAEQIGPLVTGFRGGVFKARTSPYAYSGMGQGGLHLLAEAGRKYCRPVVSEVLEQGQLRLMSEIDILQIGARNMYNYPLLKAAAMTGKPILLKRNFAATLDELLLAAEHIMAAGNERVFLCERGIRTFETRYRNSLDLTGVAVLKQLTHLPVLVDPSHAAGDSSLIESLVLASAAAGADGVIIETHLSPSQACSDAAQAITPQQLETLLVRLEKILPLLRQG